MASTTLTFDPDGDLILLFQNAVVESSVTTEDEEPPQKKFKSNGSKGLGETETSEIRMQVSSKHLGLASPVFKAMLGHGFKEGEAFRADGKVEIPLPDDDAAAMTILLAIMHGRGRRVPREVSLPQLALLSIVIDKYQAQEIAEIYTDIWINRLSNKFDHILFDYESDSSIVLMWLTISWVFLKADLFQRATKFLIREDEWFEFDTEVKVPGTDHILHLPIVALDAIRVIKEQTIAEMYSWVEAQIQKYTSPNKCSTSICKSSRFLEKNRKCDAMVLGSMIQGVSNALSVWPDPGPPHNISIQCLKHEIGAFKLLSACRVNGLCHLTRCRINNMSGFVSSAKNSEGLLLEDYRQLLLPGGLAR
ncbi:hypothetical protein ONS95_003067 [Cadophora gregata]|uniref:uncharacterized protein n=1 Tax=Cadophora gregata TaxID=51156 RepID=UPI0026DD6242|nr:uncharacterized protein ONS95_003067 [Cadophora gregata]KAK0108249.1 hypothetical protein ONS95_003067 [Cadophora gregata]KAK0109160.1 hypothetical protein ONS96_002984 [Cadophora gregata f. sp. sojae]